MVVRNSVSECRLLADGVEKADGSSVVFAGIWTNWTSVRKVKEGETTNGLFGFLTTEPNDVVAPIHAKAMPVISASELEIETWLTAPPEEALKLQRSLPGDTLAVAVWAARIAGGAMGTITSTARRTNSAATAGSRS